MLFHFNHFYCREHKKKQNTIYLNYFILLMRYLRPDFCLLSIAFSHAVDIYKIKQIKRKAGKTTIHFVLKLHF